MTASTDVQNILTAGRVYTYFLGSAVPTGAQTVEVTVSGSSMKCAGCVTVTGAYDIHISDTSTTQGTIDSPTVTVTVSVGTTGYVVAGLHSAVSAGGFLSVGSGTTEVFERDFGTEHGGMLRRNSTDSAGDVTVGWTYGAGAEDSALVGVVLAEALIVVALDRAEETEESRALTTVRAKTLDIATETDLSRNMANVFVPRVTETDAPRTLVPFSGGWPAFNGTRTFVYTTDDLDTALSGATSGTIFVLPDTLTNGIYVWTTSLPNGVTIRGHPLSAGDPSFATTVVVSTVSVGDFCTLRDLTIGGTVFTFTGTAWFENCLLTRAIANAPPTSASDYVVFSRCTFYVEYDTALFNDNGTAEGNYYFYDCLFVDGRTAGGTATPLIKTGAGDITFVNCTFSTTLANTDWLGATGGATGTATFTNCVFMDEITDIAAPGSATGTHNYSTVAPAMSLGTTVVTNLHTHTGNYLAYVPTNRSPHRAGGSTVARDFAGPMTLDRNYLPYHATAPSAGCYQWQMESSSVYKHRFSDPLDGFSFVYGANTLAESFATDFDVHVFRSHLEVAAAVRSYVWDLIHPSRGYFYVTWDGYYRLLLHSGQFDLTITAPASKIFGAVALTAEEDTE